MGAAVRRPAGMAAAEKVAGAEAEDRRLAGQAGAAVASDAEARQAVALEEEVVVVGRRLGHLDQP